MVDRIVFGNQKNWTQSSRTAFSAKMMAPYGASTEAVESITALLLRQTRLSHLVHHEDIRAGVDHTVALKCELRRSEPTLSIRRDASSRNNLSRPSCAALVTPTAAMISRSVCFLCSQLCVVTGEQSSRTLLFRNARRRVKKETPLKTNCERKTQIKSVSVPSAHDVQTDTNVHRRHHCDDERTKKSKFQWIHDWRMLANYVHDFLEALQVGEAHRSYAATVCRRHKSR